MISVRNWTLRNLHQKRSTLTPITKDMRTIRGILLIQEAQQSSLINLAGLETGSIKVNTFQLDLFLFHDIELARPAEDQREKRSSSIVHKPEAREEIAPFRQPRVEEVNLETTRYRPTNSTQNSPTEEDLPHYDLNEIELPAYCKDHPDSKLLYLTQTEDDEILCCVYCALEQKQKDPHCNVMEIKDYLYSLIDKSKQGKKQV